MAPELNYETTMTPAGHGGDNDDEDYALASKVFVTHSNSNMCAAIFEADPVIVFTVIHSHLLYRMPNLLLKAHAPTRRLNVMCHKRCSFPEKGMPARVTQQIIRDARLLDANPR